MSWVDVVTWTGLALALAQLVQVGRVASATHQAVQDVARRTGDYSVLLLVPELQAIEKECQQAAANGDIDGTLDSLRHWHKSAGEMRGYLESDPDVADAVMAQVTTSLGAATRAKAQIVDGTVTPLDATRSARNHMTKVCQESVTIGAKMRLRVYATPPPRTLPELLGAARRRLFGANEGVSGSV